MSADEKKEKKRLANVEKLEIKKAKQKAIIDAKRAKKRGITLKPSAEEGEGGEGGGEGGGEAVVEGGDDKTKLLEGDGSPGKEAKEKGKKEKGGKNKLSFEERKAAGKKNQLAKAQAKEDKHAAKLETAPTPLTRTRTLTLTPTIDPDPKPSPDPTRETLPSDHSP